MGRYCSVADVQARFRKVTDVASYPGAVESSYIFYAENMLDQKLGKVFTVPFSSNNLTARDLAIDITYAKIIIYDDPKKYKSIMEFVDSRIDDLIVGNDGMMNSDGSMIFRDGDTQQAWSNTMNCPSAFGLGDFETFVTTSDGGCYDDGSCGSTAVTSSVPGSATPVTAEKLNFIMHTGQSLALGGGTTIVVTSESLYPNYSWMLDATRGFGSSQFLDSWDTSSVSAYAADKLDTDAPVFNPCYEQSGLTRGETQGSGISEQFHYRQLVAGRRKLLNTVYRSHARAGAAITDIEKPKPPYLIGLEEVKHVKQLSETQHALEMYVPALFITHGEADRENATYGTSLLQMIADYRVDVTSITGQPETLHVFIDQTAPSKPSGLQTVVQEIQLAVVSSADNTYLTGPKYQYGYTDDVHLDAVSYRLLGEHHGYILHKVLEEGVDWFPLRPNSFNLAGNTITATFDVPNPPLVFDTVTLPAVTDYGFTVYDDGSPATITDVSITGSNTVDITLSTSPAGAVTVKYVEGGVNYPHGNLRDSLNLTSLYDGSNIYNWCVCFDRGV